MNPIEIINKFYPQEDELKRILMTHSRSVADKALRILDKHPELHMDRKFVEEAAMLHDIGIFLTHAPGIYCFGTHPYICHGYLGADLLRSEGLHRHAFVCERHTGAGIELHDIIEQQIPIPHRSMMPESPEEELICFADKFFSKTNLGDEKTVEKARSSIAKYGEKGLSRFDRWCNLFG